MTAEKKKIDFTNGKVFFKIVYFILPIIATNLLQMLYNAADMMVVSLSSESNAVGAIGATTSFLHLIVNLFIGFSVGANVVVARAIGANDGEGAQKSVHTSLLLAVIFGVSGMLLGIAVSRLVLTFMDISGDLLRLGLRYAYIYFLGVPFLALTNYLSAIFRAKGDSKTPLLVLSTAGVINVGLNLFFVLAVGLSVEGVAIATAIANAFSSFVLTIRLRVARDSTRLSLRKLKIDKKAFQEILLVGLPSGIQSALFSVSNVLIQSSIVSLNNMVSLDAVYQPVVNGNAAAANLEGFIYVAMSAVTQGAITFTGQNMGANKPHRVRRIMLCCAGIVTAIGVILSALVLAFAHPLLGLYGVVDGAEGSFEHIAYQTAATRLVYICIPYFICGLMDVFSGILRGLGKSITSTVISLIGVCLLRVVWVLTVFPRFKTLETIVISYPITWAVTAITTYILIRVLLKRILKRKAQEEKMQSEKPTV